MVAHSPNQGANYETFKEESKHVQNYVVGDHIDQGSADLYTSRLLA